MCSNILIWVFQNILFCNEFNQNEMAKYCDICHLYRVANSIYADILQCKTYIPWWQILSTSEKYHPKYSILPSQFNFVRSHLLRKKVELLCRYKNIGVIKKKFPDTKKRLERFSYFSKLLVSIYSVNVFWGKNRITG